MDKLPWIVHLEQVETSYLLLATLAGLGLAAGVLYQIGLIGWVLRGLGSWCRGGIRDGLPALGALCSRGPRGRCSWPSSSGSSSWVGWPVGRCRA